MNCSGQILTIKKKRIMSFRSEKILSLIGVDFNYSSEEDLTALFIKYLNNGMHGICFSSYLDDQGPGSILSAEQIRNRIEIIKPYTKWVRTFSCTDGNELIPRIAAEFGLKTLVGVWLDGDRENNEEELR